MSDVQSQPIPGAREPVERFPFLPGSPARATRLELALAGVFFLASGAAALVYQVTWQRVLALSTGVGIYSVAIIVGAFLAGLGLGSHLGGILSLRMPRGRALAVFALLELAIAAFAALSCTLYYDLFYLKTSWLYAVSWRAGLSHFLSLLIPTALMGMSLPFLSQAMVRDVPSAGRTIGTLYGLNVVGAALGAWLTPWLLIRHLGIRNAVLAGVACNLFAGLGALSLMGLRGGARGGGAAGERANATPLTHEKRRSFSLWMALYALSGFVALSLEIVWFRWVDVAVKSTAFTFGSVLAIYLLGLAVGSLAGAHLVDRVRRPLRAFLLCQSAVLLYPAAAAWLIIATPPSFPGFDWYFRYWGEPFFFVLGRSTEVGGLVRLYLVLPVFLYGLPTALMGFAFALLQRAVHDDPETSGRKVGLLQAANIAGNVGGSLTVGLVALSALGTTGTLRALSVSALLFAGLGMRWYGVRSVFAVAAAGTVLLLAGFPSQEAFWRRLHGISGEAALIKEDATSVVAFKEEGAWRVLVNGQRHSWLPYGGVHSRLGALPALMHPAPREVAIVGFGSGDTAWASAWRGETREVSVFEIAAPQFELLRRLTLSNPDEKAIQLLGDLRVSLRVADGRNALFRDDRLYDIIVVDAVRPITAYSGNLNSVEFFELCARRLKPGGMVSIWVPTARVNSSFRKAIPYVLNVLGGEMFVGSIHPIPVDYVRWRDRLLSPAARDYLGPEVVTDVMEALKTARPALPGGSPETELNRDLFPRDEFLTPGGN